MTDKDKINEKDKNKEGPSNEKENTPLMKEESKLKNLIVKQGDYQIHVLIESLSQLSLVDDSLPDPCIKISCVDDSQRTKNIGVKLKERSFDEHFYFTHKGLNMEKFDSAKILLEVYDRNNTSKEDYLGVQEIDYATVYSAEDHCIKNHWIALSNIYSEKDFSTIKGYLRVSISILHDDDKRVELNSNQNDSGLISTAPHITNKYMQLKAAIIKAEDLPDMDSMSEKKTNKECDGFVTMFYMGKKISTSVIKMKDNLIVWNEVLMIPFIYPTTSEKILFKLYDEDIGSNDLVGSFEVNVYDVINGLYIRPRYINIYGGPQITSGKFTDIMNENAEIGSSWKGRVLISLSSNYTNEPKMGKDPLIISSHITKGLEKKNLWVLDFELMDAMFLPIEKGKVTFAFCYEDSMITTPLRTVNKGNILGWNLKRKQPFYHLSNRADELSDVFIYLCNGENEGIKSRVCFQRIPATELLDNKDVIVFKLLADPAIGKIDNCKSLIRMKLKLTLEKENADQNAFDKLKSISEVDKVDPYEAKEKPITVEPVKIQASKPEEKPIQSPPKQEVKPPPKKVQSDSDSDDLDSMVKTMSKKKIPETKPAIVPPSNQNKAPETKPLIPATQIQQPIQEKLKVVEEKIGHTVIANVYMSKEFIAGDDNGTSDPYVEVTCEGNIQSTSVKYDQINGAWNESLVFRNLQFDINDISTWPILYMRVLDEDTLSSDPLGYSYIWLSSSSYKVNTLEKINPKWHQFRLCLSDRPQGKLLLSFYIIEDKFPKFQDLHNQIANLNISPDTDMYDFDINILGLRKLEPLGIMPVKRPYIHFDLNSIIIPGKNKDQVHPLKSIKTDPIYPGANPTINTTINFKFNLPREEVFVPSLTCMVYDKILFGLGSSMLGIFSMDLMDLVQKTMNVYKQDLAMSKDKVGMGVLSGVLGKNMNDMTKVDEYEKELKLKEEEEQRKQKEEEQRKQKEEEQRKQKEEEQRKLKEEKILNELIANQANTSDKNQDLKDDSHLDVIPNETSQSLELDQTELLANSKKKGELAVLNNEKRGSKKELKELLIPIESKENLIDKLINISNNPENDEKLIQLKKLVDSNIVIIKPQFNETKTFLPGVDKYIKEDTKLIPNNEKYYELGYENPNKPKADNEKHYRRYYNQELEEVSELRLKSPFINIPIRRDKFIDNLSKDDVFNRLSSKHKIIKRFTKDPNNKDKYIEKESDKKDEQMSSVKLDEHGYFKGLIFVTEHKKKEHFLNVLSNVSKVNPMFMKDFKNFNKFKDLSKELLIKKQMICRVYVLEMHDLAKRDITSESDPYLVISLGGKVINEKDKHVDDSANVRIYRTYE